MNALKTVLVVFVVVVIIGYLILGHDETMFNARGWQAQTQDLVRDAGPAEVNLEKLWAEIREAEEKIYELEAAARIAAGDTSAMSRQASELEAEVSNLREQVEIGKRLLQERRDEYVVAGRAMSPSEFIEVLNYKADEYARRSAQHENLRSGAEERALMAKRLARESTNLEAMIESERMELMRLKHEYQMARVGRDMANIVGDFNLDSDIFADGPYASLKRNLQEVTHRLQAEADYKMRKQGLSVAQEIDFRDPADPEDIASLIRDIDRKMGVTTAEPRRPIVLEPAAVAITE